MYLLLIWNPSPLRSSSNTFSTWVFATTTKICTKGCSTRGRPHTASQQPSRVLLLDNTSLCARCQSSIGNFSSRHLSAIHFRGRFIRQVSCYTLLSGFRLPWPPSCCLYESTPFLGSAWVPPLGSLTRVRLVHPTSPVLLTRCGPLVTCNIKHTLWMLEKSVIGYHLKVWE